MKTLKLNTRLILMSMLMAVLSLLSVQASNYYWIGGSGNWDQLNHWATTSGGTTLHTVIPTAADDVYFDAGSGFTPTGNNVTINVTSAFCHNMDWTDAANSPVLAGDYSNTLRIYGSLIFISAMSNDFFGIVYFEATTTGQNITTGGQILKNSVYFEGAGGGWLMRDNFICWGQLRFVRGTLNTNSNTVAAGWFYSDYTNSRTLILGSSILNLSQGWYYGWEVDHTNLTLNVGTSTINITGLNGQFYANPAGMATYYNVNFTNASSDTYGGIPNYPGNLNFHDMTFTGGGTLTGSNTINNLTFSGGKSYELSAGSTQTIINNLNASASCSGMISIQSTNAGTQATISKSSGNITVNYVSLKDIHASGGASFTANNSIDLGNNTGWIINSLVPKDLYWVDGSGNWDDQSHWSLSSGGTGGACIPTSFDNVFFDAASGFTALSNTVTINANASCHNMNWTGATNNPVLEGYSPGTLNIYGSLTFIPGMTYNFNGFVYFEASTPGQTITTGGQLFLNYIYFEGTGGWILQDEFNSISWIFYYSGNLNTNSQTLNAESFSAGNSNSRVLTLGASVLNLGSNWGVDHSNLTFDAGTSTINITGTYGQFTTYDATSVDYYNVNFTDPTAGVYVGIYPNGGDLSFHDVAYSGGGSVNGSSTFNTLTFSSGKPYKLESGQTQTILGSLNASATCSGMINISSSTSGEQAIISKSSGNVTIDYVVLKDIAGTGGATFTANNTIDLGNNTGWTINTVSPKNLYWVGGAGNWDDAAHWSFTSGGAGGACLPTPFDDVFFDANSGFVPGSETVTINVNATCHNMNWTGALNNPVLEGSNLNTLSIYGSLTFINAMNVTFNGLVYFNATTGGQTITAGAQYFQNNVYFDGSGGGWTLQDAFSCGSEVYLNRGSLNTNGQTINAQSFYSTNTNVRELILGSSVLNLVTYWSVEHNNLVFDAGTSVINITNTWGSFYANASGSAYYYDLQFTAVSSGIYLSLDTHGDIHFHDATFYGGISIYGNHTFHNMIFSAGQTYQLESGRTQTILGKWGIQGSCTSYILLQTNNNGSFATVSKTGGSVSGYNLHIRDIHCTGGANFIAYNSLDLGGNSGWNFAPLNPVLSNPGPINGPACTYDGQTGVTYSIAPVPGAISYLWTVPAGVTITSGQGDELISVNIGNATSGEVTVSAFNGCVYSATTSTLTITIISTSITSTNVSCNATILGSATVNAGGGTSPYSYLWSNGETTAIVNDLPVGTYYVTVTDANGCSAISAQVTITENPSTLVTAGNVSGCAGTAIALSGSPAGGIFSAANPYTGPGTTYTYTYVDGNGCIITSAPATITVNPLPVVTAGNVSGCAGTAIALSGSPAGGAFSVANPYTGPGTNYTYTYTDGNGCTNTSAAATIVVHALPNVTATSNSPVCTGSTLNLYASGGVLYSWAGPDGFTSTYQNPSITNFTPSAEGIYIVTITDGNGCTVIISVMVTLNPNCGCQTFGGLSEALSHYVILTRTHIQLKRSTIMSGGVGVQNDDHGHGKLEVKENSIITASGTFARSNHLEKDNSSQIMTFYNTPANVPFPIFEAMPYNSNLNVNIGQNQIVYLNDTLYKEIKVGKNATAIFTKPVVNIREKLKMEDGATLKFNQCTKVRAEDGIETGENIKINPDDRYVVFYCGKDVKIKGGAHVTGAFFLGEVGGHHSEDTTYHHMHIEDSKSTNPAVFKGIYLAECVHSGKYTSWYLDNFCNYNCTLVHLKNMETEEQNISIEEPGMILKNYPNPFNDKTHFEFMLPEDNHVRLDVYDLSGKWVQSLYNGDVGKNQEYKAEFDGTGLSDGIYIYKMVTHEDVYTGKMMMMK